MPKYITAIDIGTTKIVAIAGKRTIDDKIEVLGIGQAPSNGVKRGVVANIEETSKAIQEAVRQAEEVSQIKFKDVYVGIAGMHIRSTRNRAYKHIENDDLEIKQIDIDNLIRDIGKTPIDPGEEIIHIIPQSYVVDKEAGITGDSVVGMAGKRVEGNFHIVIGKTTAAKNIKKCVERVGLSVKKLILEPLASAEAVLSKDEKEAGVALIDIGGGTSDVAVFYEETIRHTAVIPLGGNNVTKDIKEGCAILQRYAEKAKVEYGSAMASMAEENSLVSVPTVNGNEKREIPLKDLAYIIQARMEDIIDIILFEIENSGLRDRLSAGIAITGGGALLKNLPQLIKFKTGLDVRLAYPNIYFNADNKELARKINMPMFATSVGLLLKGLEVEKKIEQKEKENIKKQEKLKIERQKEQEKQQQQVVEEQLPSKKREKPMEKIKSRIFSFFSEEDGSM